ncbi:MAG: hypothetical protein P1V20_29640 [Verrucomicrobiales bacterium]|nr:hypothetical protein [Verrucomicrobiales bacterium]
MNLLDLDDQTRKLMVEEINLDISSEKLYLSDRLTPTGAGKWREVLLSAVESADIGWLVDQINNLNLLRKQTPRKTKTGATMVKVPSNASQTLAEGEFNRYYIRAVCRRAIEAGQDVFVYRAKSVNKPRPQSESLIGKSFDPETLLNDLRESIGFDAAMGLPPGPNSCLTAGLKPYS